MKTNITHTIETITPDIAAEMLKCNPRNRPIYKTLVKRLVADMKLARWEFNGDAIRFSDEGELLDGQHRLTAVVQSGTSIAALVIRGLPRGTFATMDTGKLRNGGDTLAVNGEKNARNLAAALAVLDRLMTGRMEQRVTYANWQIEELIERYPDIRRSMAVCDRTHRIVPRSIMAACHYMFAQRDKVAADAFVEAITKGVNLTAGDPVYLARERLLQNATAKAKLLPDYIAALLIKAWNSQRADSPVRALRYRQQGPQREAFPVVK
jgi:hypothetical protein